MEAIIPEIINNFNLYLSGNRLLGITGEVEVPEFKAITSPTSGVGILGQYDALAIGHYESTEQEITFRCFNEDYFKLISPTKTIELTLRGSIQHTIKESQNTDYVGTRIVYRGRCKSVKTGTIRQRGQMECSITMELTYCKIELDGVNRFELDKVNEVFKVNGEDLLAKIKALT